MDHLCFFCLVFVMPLCVSVYLYLVVTCWERADLLALVCGILGQVSYLIVSIHDFCTLNCFMFFLHIMYTKYLTIDIVTEQFHPKTHPPNGIKCLGEIYKERKSLIL